MLALLLDFGVLLFGHDVKELLYLILGLHVSLDSPPLARGLENVHTTALGRYKEKVGQIISIPLQCQIAATYC